VALARAGAAALLYALVAAASAGASVQVSASPGLRPPFDRHVSDYVSGCKKGRPLRLSVDASGGDAVGVDGAHSRTGRFDAKVPLAVGQSTQLLVRAGGHKRRYHVRCLPSRFPAWRWQRYGRPQGQWYLFAPSTIRQVHTDTRYVVLMDGRGVPVWWTRADVSPFSGVLLGGPELAWTRWYGDPFGMRDSSAWEIHRLDGTLVRTLQTVGSPTDTHDMEPMPNGDYLLDTYRLRKDVDLAPWGGHGRFNVLDGEIQRVTPAGAVVWSWNSKDHVVPSETPGWQSLERRLPDGTPAYDVFHLNSVALDGKGGLVISARNVNAVYRIDLATGDVTWKLGGTKRPQSLHVVGDPLSPTFRGQHDARVLPDGTVTVYDNRSDIGPPRAVRFRIDASARKARWVEQVTDPKATKSGSEGSARRLSGGDWVVSWGGTGVASEISSKNRPLWRLKFADTMAYRVVPVPFGTLSAASLRRAMDRMFPRK
jgi:Arylsulfotransferase (ASST)